MSNKNKKNTISQALLEMDDITNAIKEESKKQLNTLLTEAVRNALRENCNEAEEDEYEVVDDNNDKNDTIDTTNDSNVETSENDENSEDNNETENVENEQEASIEDDNEEKDWNEFSKYQVSDNTYDLTGENDYESIVKVYKKLKDDDQVIIRKDNNIIHLEDNTTDTEYVIDLGDEENSNEIKNGEENNDSLNENFEFYDYEDGFSEEDDDSTLSNFLKDPKNQLPSNNGNEIAGFENDEEFSEEDFDEEYDDFSEEDFDEEFDENIYESKKINKESKKTKKPMKESKEVLFEVDLGYTDNYQDKDPIDGLSNNEPSKSGKSWHKGVPTGTEKPWAGETKSKGKPFEKTISEEEMVNNESEEIVDEATNVGGAVQQRSNSKSHIPANRKEYGPKVKRHVSTEGNYDEIVAENKKLKNENKELKSAIISFKKYLTEAYVTNANLGKITKLFLENTTSQNEKIEIVNRFSNEAKTIEQSKALYESIKRELNKTASKQVQINETMSTTNNSEQINENKVYKSDDLIKSIDLINRMKNY